MLLAVGAEKERGVGGGVNGVDSHPTMPPLKKKRRRPPSRIAQGASGTLNLVLSLVQMYSQTRILHN